VHDRLQPGSSTLLVVLIAAITAAGLLLRLPSFGDSLFGDELSTHFIVTGHGVGHIIYALQGHSIDLNPPLFFVLAWVAERFGDGAHALRLVSLCAGTAAIPLTYLLGLWTVGRRAALVGAALMALSPFLIFYSTEARAYALLLLLVLVCTLCLLRALDARQLRWWAAYAVCSCAAVYTHYIAVFFLGTLFVWAFLARPDARRALFGATLAAAIGYIPWLPTVLKDTRSPGNLVIGFLEPFSPHLVASYLARWSIGHSLFPLATLPGRAAIAILAVGLAAGLLGVALRARRANGTCALPRLSAGTVLVVVLVLAPPAEIALYSSLGHSVWESRNLIAGWPGLALAVGALLTGARDFLRVAAVALVVLAYAIGAAKMLDPSYQRPDYNSAVSFIDRVGSSGDPVIDLPGPTPGPLTDLDGAFAQTGQSPRGRHPVLRLGYPPLSALLRSRPYAPVPPTAPAAVIRQAADLARGRAIFVVAPRQEAAILAALLKPLPARFRRVETRTFAGLVPMLVYVFRDSQSSRGFETRSLAVHLAEHRPQTTDSVVVGRPAAPPFAALPVDAKAR
jgi:mannosyltransferase